MVEIWGDLCSGAWLLFIIHIDVAFGYLIQLALLHSQLRLSNPCGDRDVRFPSDCMMVLAELTASNDQTNRSFLISRDLEPNISPPSKLHVKPSPRYPFLPSISDESDFQ